MHEAAMQAYQCSWPVLLHACCYKSIDEVIHAATYNQDWRMRNYLLIIYLYAYTSKMGIGGCTQKACRACMIIIAIANAYSWKL